MDEKLNDNFIETEEVVEMEETTEVQQPKESEKNEFKAEDALHNVATILLVFGLLATIICAFALCFPKVGILERREFNPAGFATTFSILMSSLVLWSIMRVLGEISTTLKKIHRKMDKQKK